MEPQNLRFGGGVSETVLNPVVIVAILVAGVLICACSRKTAISSFLAASILIPMDQVLLIGPIHFPMLRILILFGMIRILRTKASSASPLLAGGTNKIDFAVICFTLVTAASGILLFQVPGAVIFELGNLYTVFGVYFLLRTLVRDEADVEGALRSLACIAAGVAVTMAYEQLKGWNPYALLEGARASTYASLMERDNRFRATACFSHPILAGVFGAILFPLFVALWHRGKNHRRLALVGIVSATVITLASNSSTPILAYAAGVLGFGLWPLRKLMRAIRWGIVVTLVSLHLVMKAPVWHLISRIEALGGSSYHRYMLVDQCIRHFGDWWLLGVKGTFSWGWDMWDTANQYVNVSENSGLLALILFIAVIVHAFKYVGRARRAARQDRKKELFVWSLGVALFANVVAFFGISYFDQTMVVWYGLLAMISAAVVCPKTDQLAWMKNEEAAENSLRYQETEPCLATAR